MVNGNGVWRQWSKLGFWLEVFEIGFKQAAKGGVERRRIPATWWRQTDSNHRVRWQQIVSSPSVNQEKPISKILNSENQNATNFLHSQPITGSPSPAALHLVHSPSSTTLPPVPNAIDPQPAGWQNWGARQISIVRCNPSGRR
ncbi:hypothetical protein RHMOL_Rhmol11G0092200 [Rhododendron molle]|uniref:Uncharacterized protein n=1 Tax=Rhododendron molle TaxID=49168 RepID=A0ACC0LQ78_RHOML|nr:hypothetical protein RHMOL_Rhmol11G0092200 [Rhododendron molle]